MKIVSRIALALVLVASLSLVAAGCSNPGGGDWTGKITDLSRTYLYKGYAFNLYRSASEVGTDAASLGKSYIDMAFSVLPEYTSTNDYDPSAGYNVKKFSIGNVHVVSSSKMGTVGSLSVWKPGTVDPSGPRVDLVGSLDRADFAVSPADSSGRQTVLYLELDKVAQYDLAKSPAAANGASPTMEQIYRELGIDRSAVTLKLAFRIELVTVSGKTLFHDVEIELPPSNVDVTGPEFHYEYFVAEVTAMEPFLEK